MPLSEGERRFRDAVETAYQRARSDGLDDGAIVALLLTMAELLYEDTDEVAGPVGLAEWLAACTAAHARVERNRKP